MVKTISKKGRFYHYFRKIMVKFAFFFLRKHSMHMSCSRVFIITCVKQFFFSSSSLCAVKVFFPQQQQGLLFCCFFVSTN